MYKLVLRLFQWLLLPSAVPYADIVPTEDPSEEPKWASLAVLPWYGWATRQLLPNDLQQATDDLDLYDSVRQPVSVLLTHTHTLSLSLLVPKRSHINHTHGTLP